MHPNTRNIGWPRRQRDFRCDYALTRVAVELQLSKLAGRLPLSAFGRFAALWHDPPRTAGARSSGWSYAGIGRNRCGHSTLATRPA